MSRTDMIAAIREVVEEATGQVGQQVTMTRTLLRTMGFRVTDDLERDVDTAIDTERCKGQDFLSDVARELGATSTDNPHPWSWPRDRGVAIDHLKRAQFAVRLQGGDLERGRVAIKQRDELLDMLTELLETFYDDPRVREGYLESVRPAAYIARLRERTAGMRGELSPYDDEPPF